jgi:hypothetical protein
MRTADLLQAARDLRLDHSWSTLEVDLGGRTAYFGVSTDAVKLKDTGARITCDAIGQQQLADLWGAHLLTSGLMELRYAAADIVVLPSPGDVTKDYDGRQHSARIDRAVQREIDGGAAAGGMVAGMCKTWILDPKCTTVKSVNHGWIVDRSKVRGTGSPRGTWNGIPVRQCEFNDHYLIQNRGAAHTKNHLDYSQMALFVSGKAEVDGTIVDTADLFADPETARYLVGTKSALGFTRQPGVAKETL